MKTSKNWLMSLVKNMQVFIVLFFPLLYILKTIFQNKNVCVYGEVGAAVGGT